MSHHDSVRAPPAEADGEHLVRVAADDYQVPRLHYTETLVRVRAALYLGAGDVATANEVLDVDEVQSSTGGHQFFSVIPAILAR
jgi:hypothetical protein